MRKSNFALLQPSLLAEARQMAEAEGVALNQLINVAVAEKLSALRTEKYFADRAARANIPNAFAILKRAGVGTPPIKGDKLRRASRPWESKHIALTACLRARSSHNIEHLISGKTVRAGPPRGHIPLNVEIDEAC
jgi:hypothetical protein